MFGVRGQIWGLAATEWYTVGEGIEMNCLPVISIVPECVRRGFNELLIATNCISGMQVAPCSGHNRVTKTIDGDWLG